MANIEKPFRTGPSVAAAAPPFRRVAVLIETSHGSARQEVLGIGDYLREHGLRWSIDHEPRRMETGPPPWLSRWRGDGVIARLYRPETLAAVERLGVPVVDTWVQPWAAALPRAEPDNVAIGALAARHLLERGFRQFAFVGVTGIRWSDLRAAGFAAAVAAHGFPCGRFTFRAGRRSCLPPGRSRRLADWLRRQPRPIGILAANDYYAATVVHACTSAGISIPEQAAIVGVDNDEAVCELASPSLTSIAIDHRRTGFEAARLLARLMNGGRGPTHVSLPVPGIICRRSTAGNAVEDAVVAAALETIRGHATHSLTIDDIAAHLGVSRASLTKSFAATVGHGIHEEIVRVRLREAQRLLAEADMKLDVVARQSGLENARNLCRVFRRELGRTPGAYRRAMRRASKAN